MLYRSLRNHVAKIHREFPFDVILAAWAYPDAFAAALLAADYRCPLVVTVLGSDINDLAFRPSIRQKVRWALERAAMVVAVSAALRNRLVELGLPAERVAVQYNAVNGEMFKPRDKRDARARLGLPVDTPLVGYIGNFVREKGVDVLVEASGLLPRSGDRPATMVLVGSGPMQQQLQNRTNELGLAERVIFAGRRTHTEIPDWMSAFDILVLPSRSEGCPNVVLEALASGVPTVGTTVGGVPELLDRNNGVLVAPDDALSLASGIRAALEQDWSPDYLRSTVKYLSWDDVGRAYWDLLRGISST
jgi:glycosyltransferase involved in cell wall biosynthesis